MVLRIIDGWFYEKAMVKAFVHWVGITLAHMEREREEVRSADRRREEMTITTVLALVLVLVRFYCVGSM